jgi:hypothetical protein
MMTPPPTISKLALGLVIILALLALAFVVLTPDFLSGPPVYQGF